MLNRNPIHRCDIIQLRISPWMRGTIETLRPYAQLKYRLEECLPRDFLRSSVAPHAPSAQNSPPVLPHIKVPVAQVSLLNGQGPSDVGHNREIERPPTEHDPEKRSAAAEQANSKHRGIKTKLGAAGRKIAHAVFHVNYTHHNNGHT